MNKQMKPKIKNKIIQGRVSIRTRLFASFSLFSVFIIAFLWISQIFLLDKIYYNTTLDALGRTSSELVRIYDSDSFEESARQYAIDGQMCISVYRVEPVVVKPLLSTETSIGCVVHKLSGTQLSLIYNRAAEGGGSYYTSSTLKLVFNPRLNARELRAYIPDENIQNDMPFPVDSGVTADERLVFCRLFRDGEHDIMIILDAPLAPVTPVVNTLRLLLVVISVIILLVSLLLAYAISSKLSRPLVKMSERAKDLADGNYSADFSDGSYKEVKQLGSTLNYAAERLSDVERMQRELVANISHDLRTPLTMIKGYAEIMRDIEGENTPENTQVIIDETERLSELVNDILVISRHQSGNAKLEFCDFDVFGEISETVERYRRLKSADGFEFALECDGCATVHADRSAVLQVVCNLINNAINYAVDKRVEVKCYKNGGYAHVDVIDHGDGIPEQELPNIWQRYYKVDKTHSRSRVGSGLGLSIVRGILELHGARYGVSSSIGVGSRFWFELPIAADFSENES